MKNDNRVVSLSTASNDFIKVARVLAQSRGEYPVIQELARSVKSERAREVLKSNVAPLGITGGASAAELAPYRELATGFFGSMAAQSAFSKIYNAGDFTRVPLRTLIAVLSTAPSAHWVSELAPKPITSMDFSTATLEPTKVSALVVITDELARSISPAATSRLGDELRRAASIEVDKRFLAILAATPSITSAGSSGLSAANILSDLTSRLNAMTIGADSRLWLIVSPKVAKEFSLVQGTGGYIVQNGSIGDIRLAVSDAATSTATLIDAKQIAVELDGISLDSTREATLQLVSDPVTDGTSNTVSASLWQQNLTGLKVEIQFGAIAMRSTGLSEITGYA